jgi:hypothetical protein
MSSQQAGIDEILIERMERRFREEVERPVREIYRIVSNRY